MVLNSTSFFCAFRNTSCLQLHQLELPPPTSWMVLDWPTWSIGSYWIYFSTDPGPPRQPVTSWALEVVDLPIAVCHWDSSKTRPKILTGTFFATCKVGDTPNSDFTQHLVSAAPPEEMPWLLPLPCREEKTIECDTAIPAQGGLLYLAWWLSQNWQHRKHKLQCLGLIMKNVVAMSRGTIRGLQTSSRKTWFALYCSSKSSNREATSDTPSLWSFGWYIWLMISQYCTRFTHWLLLAFHLHKHLEHPIHINPWWPGRNTEHMPRSIPCDPPWLPSWMSCPARTNVEEHLAISDIKHTMKGMMTQFPSTIFHDFHSILPRKFALLRL